MGGVIGIRFSIMLPHDPKGQQGPKIPLDDVVTIMEPKEEVDPATLLAAQQQQQQYLQQQAAAAAQQQEAAAAEEAAPYDPGMSVEPAPMEEDPNVTAGF